ADFAGAGANFVELGVAPQATDREFVDVAVTAQDLDRFTGKPGRLFRGVEDDAGAVLANLTDMTTALRVEVLADRVQVRAACLLGGVHVGDLALDQLEFTDALAELLAVVDIRNDHVHRRLHQAQWTAAEHRALVVEAAHQHLDAFADAAKHVLFRHLDILKHQFAGV